MKCWFRDQLIAAADEDEKKRQHPTPESQPGKPIPMEAPPAESPMPEIEPYQMPPQPTPDMPQPTA